MAAQSGKLLVIKSGDGGDPEVFTTVAGLKTTQMVLNNRIVATNTAGMTPWRSLMANAGIRSLAIQGIGRFDDSEVEARLFSQALTSTVNHYQLCFGNGDMLEGLFLIQNYERMGDFDAEESYSIRLESAGEITFTAG